MYWVLDSSEHNVLTSVSEVGAGSMVAGVDFNHRPLDNEPSNIYVIYDASLVKAVSFI